MMRRVRRLRNVGALRLFAMFALLAFSATSYSAAYEVVFEQSYAVGKAEIPKAFSISRSRSGGYIVAGRGLPSQGWVLATDALGKKKWEVLSSGTPGSTKEIHMALEVSNGDTVAVGTTNSHDIVLGDWGDDGRPPDYHYFHTPRMGYTARFDARGRSLWQKVLGSVKRRDGGIAYCGAVSPLGIVLVGNRGKEWTGQPTRNGTAYQSVIWVATVDDTGALSWHSTVWNDGPDLLDARHLDGEGCSGPLLQDDGSFVFAVSVQEQLSVVMSGKRLIAGPDIKARSTRTFVLVTRFDRRGRELARARIDGATHPRLATAPVGFVVLDNPTPVLEHGIRRTLLDHDLHVVEQKEAKLDGFAFGITAMQPGPNGGFHLAGYKVVPPNTRGRPAIGFLTGDLQLRALRTFGPLLSGWGDPVALAPGSNLDEVVMLRQGGNGPPIGIIKFRLMP